ncbi:MAG: glucose-6-phosphate isomerase [Phycisphaeraceae bacterium]|nr:MAG: glucose-6-phosphate isomerase [Phycisphaeraceae bacterium]
MLTLDYANCLADRVTPTHGLDPQALTGPLAERAKELTARLEKTRGTGWERWRLLADPAGTRPAHVQAVKAIAEKHSSGGKCKWDNLVVLGIGGSALGNIALQAALNPLTHNIMQDGGSVRRTESSGADSPGSASRATGRRGPRLFVIDNVDPANFTAIMAECPPERTLFNVVSKSGETAETAGQFMIIRDLLARAVGSKGADHIVAVTDAEKGTMRQICDAAGYDTLPVPEGVGGRFSVLSPVGLFSAAMCGIDIDRLLGGAHEMETKCRNPELAKNPAAMLATILVELGRGGGPARRAGDHGPADRATIQPKPNHVLMPYCNGLYLLADWFRQLWAESLGKRHDTSGKEVFEGFTPIKALGATDQHSQVQLYREGPNDKVFGLMEVESFGEDDVTIPTGLGVDTLAYLEGKKMSALLNAEKRATEYALVESERPNFTIRFPMVNEHTVGEFIMLWQVATAYAGLMLNIDAYDQPAVETGKKATFGLMGREGYGEWLEKVSGTLRQTVHVIS